MVNFNVDFKLLGIKAGIDTNSLLNSVAYALFLRQVQEPRS